MPVENRYFCLGTCGSIISQEQYNEGFTHCGTDGCPMYGKWFQKWLYCHTCGKKIEEGQELEHQH